MDKSQDLLTRKGITIEITPPSSPDTYGGWWVSVYHEKLLDEARASEEELKQIAVAKAPPPLPAPPSVAAASARANQRPVAVQPVVRVPDPDETGWSAAEMAMARVTSSPSRSSSSGGSVFVRGYYRKNGTYVHSYTRRK